MSKQGNVTIMTEPKTRNRAPSHHPGCTVPANAPRSDHVEGCRYRSRRTGKRITPDVQHRPRVTEDEAAAIARAKGCGVDIVKALDGASNVVMVKE